jgi:hypothetical protein
MPTDDDLTEATSRVGTTFIGATFPLKRAAPTLIEVTSPTLPSQNAAADAAAQY